MNTTTESRREKSKLNQLEEGMQTKLLSISSVSGGKTSSFMALKYPTDHYVFALVKTLDKNCIPKDKFLLNEAKKRVPDFVGSREVDETLIRILDLEQRIGKSIKWVSSHLSYDELISQKKMLPNTAIRFCTSELKLKPIFEYCYHLNSLSGLVYMHIGFRYDETQRREKMLSTCEKAYQFKFPYLCNLNSKKQSWKNVEWRIPGFPLIENKVTHAEIIRFWRKQNVSFPEISNCDFCFFHTYQQQLKQMNKYPDRFNWWLEQEKSIGRTFKKEYPYEDIQNSSIHKLPLFQAPEDYSCSCTD